MLIITFFTVCAMGVTAIGCAANSNDSEIIQLTNWGTAWYRNGTTDEAYKFYVGLSQFVVLRCPDAQGDDTYAEKWYHKCEVDNTRNWDTVTKDNTLEYGIEWSAVKACKEQAVKNQFGVIVTCVTMIFALVGCLTRMRKVADTNFQKLIGCLPDTLGVITLTITLVDFYDGCYAAFPSQIGDGMDLTIWVGPGYSGFVCCLVVTFLRVTCHYLTPTPGKGVEGMCCEDDKEGPTSKLELSSQDSSFDKSSIQDEA